MIQNVLLLLFSLARAARRTSSGTGTAAPSSTTLLLELLETSLADLSQPHIECQYKLLSSL